MMGLYRDTDGRLAFSMSGPCTTEQVERVNTVGETIGLQGYFDALVGWWRGPDNMPVNVPLLKAIECAFEMGRSVGQADLRDSPAQAAKDPMDWPLPCDVTVGHGTMRKGVPLRTLVTRMKVLYEMATGANADEVAAEPIETREARYQALTRQLRGDAPRNPGELLDMVLAELERATRKFPTWPTDPHHALSVLGEEFGELTKAVVQVTYEPHKTTMADVRTEAIQTAAMAIRWANSLAVYAYRPSEQHQQEAL